MQHIKTKQFTTYMPKRTYDRLREIGMEKDLRVPAVVRNACEDFIRAEEDRRAKRQIAEKNSNTLVEQD